MILLLISNLIGAGTQKNNYIVLALCLIMGGCTQTNSNIHKWNVNSVTEQKKTIAPPIKQSYGPIEDGNALTVAGQIIQKKKDSLAGPLLVRSQFIAAVLRANPKLEVAQAAWQASIARVKQQSALDDPVFAYRFAPATIGNNQMRFGQKFEVSQKLPWPGKLKLKSAAAKSTAIANQENIQSVRLNLIALAKQLFADWYYIHQAIDITSDHLKLLDQLKKIAVMRYQLGRSKKQDVLQADLEYSELVHQQYKFTQKKNEISGQINTLISRPMNTLLPPPEVLLRPFKIPQTQVILEMAMNNHPELKVINANIESLQFNQLSTQLDTYPDIQLKAGYNSLWDNNDKHFTVGFVVNLPLDQSKRQAAVDEATARLKEVGWYKTDIINQLTENIQIHLIRVKESEHSLLICTQKFLPLSRQNMRAAKQDYQAGQGDFFILIEAEKKWHKYRLKAAQSLTNYHRSMALLERTVGVSSLRIERF